MEASSVRVFAPAKVNLYLGVGGVRSDGYHDVTTVLHTLELGDELVVSTADALSLDSVPQIVAPEDNLVWRAAEAMAQRFDRTPGFAMRLVKRVPHGAGLGGGSSDAAAAIAGIAQLWGVERLHPACLEVAASLGADVPFFLAESGCALMTGRGDLLEEELPAMAGLPVVLVKPAAPVPTGAAYAAFDAQPQPAGCADNLVTALRRGDAAGMAVALANNMQGAACSVVPEVAEVLAFLNAGLGMGSETVKGAIVAGSGSAVVGLCETETGAHRLADAARDHGWWAASTRLAGSGVTVERR